MATQWPYPFWIAHRGAGRHAPENTMAALRHGWARGFRAFEVDAKISVDGVPFLLHDTTLDRTTTEHGPASERTWSELQTLDAGSWHHSEHAFEPIPSLEQVLRWSADHGAHLNIEIKPTPGDEGATGRAVAALAAQFWPEATLGSGGPGARPPLPSAPLLSAFRTGCLRAAREAAPHLPRALLVNRLMPGWIDEAIDIECCACVLQHELAEPALIESLQARGLRVWVYTVNDAAEAQRLVDWGVEGLITDAVHQFDPRVHPRT